MSNILGFSKGMEDGRWEIKLGSEAGGQCDKGFPAKAGLSTALYGHVAGARGAGEASFIILFICCRLIEYCLLLEPTVKFVKFVKFTLTLASDLARVIHWRQRYTMKPALMFGFRFLSIRCRSSPFLSLVVQGGSFAAGPMVPQSMIAERWITDERLIRLFVGEFSVSVSST